MENTNFHVPTMQDTFIKVAKSIERKGNADFLDWLIEETDFIKAPASTRFHGAYEGGLVIHSLMVYKNLLYLAKNHYTDLDTLKIVSLYHDVCKANFYITSTRNVKNDETGKWEKVPYYTVDEQYPYGAHGSKSVYLIMSHGLDLFEDEAAAINCHMGGWDVTSYHNPSKAYEKYPIAVYLHLADMLASYIDKS